MHQPNSHTILSSNRQDIPLKRFSCKKTGPSHEPERAALGPLNNCCERNGRQCREATPIRENICIESSISTAQCRNCPAIPDFVLDLVWTCRFWPPCMHASSSGAVMQLVLQLGTKWLLSSSCPLIIRSPSSIIHYSSVIIHYSSFISHYSPSIIHCSCTVQHVDFIRSNQRATSSWFQEPHK